MQKHQIYKKFAFYPKSECLFLEMRWLNYFKSNISALIKRALLGFVLYLGAIYRNEKHKIK